MSPQEHVFFDDGSVYISETSLVLRRGGNYPIASLAQVTFARIAAKRFWISILVFFGLLFLVIGWLLGSLIDQQAIDVRDYPYENSTPYPLIGGSLLVLAVIIAVFQTILPVYVVLLKGSFGSAQPIKSRNRSYIERVVVAINQAMHQSANAGNTRSSVVIHNNPNFSNAPTFNNNLIRGSFNDAKDIAVGNDARVTRTPWPDNRFGNDQSFQSGQSGQGYPPGQSGQEYPPWRQ